ncbi:RNA polymerase 2 mediator complex component [Grosmannia clavigera kw1407]|uniref:Mediator of RNA polymerase II transcription subunit 17 n=1 Tax=Grosmannia clavigera (strain kw1407 / UAMH 11150) TaxID=655863 RepID=F0XGG4_GROCL|nr:RNA polymerase 2 mediator complex component [Grosmannia clavigera kw1407]EFX02596.1 RNA polymerase 2 mediator complex component [Grosmannia clavigera kw1407]
MADSAGTADTPALFGLRDAVFRPWPLPGQEPANIGDFVRRIKAQGGEFRKLTEESLRKEIEERRTRREAGNGSDGDDADEASGRGADENEEAANDTLAHRTKGIEAMIAKRDEVLRTLESALQNGLIVVDFVSLLLSKDRPTQALQSLSPMLREKIGIGTLSAGRIANAAQAAKALQTRHGGGRGGGGGPGLAGGQILDETTRSNAQRVLDHKIECVGWQLLAMDRAAELLAAGRKRLHAELRREQMYWSEVVAVRDRGWALSRTPGQRRLLRVKFGFSEAAADLRAAGFAPLRRVKRGHVALDITALGPPSAIVVTLRRRNAAGNVDIIGRSSPPIRLPPSAPLENRILEARNTVYAKELWRELNREARLLVAHGIALRGPLIVFPAGAHTEGIIALEPLQLVASDAGAVAIATAEMDRVAEVTASSLHLFLAHGHRHHYRLRSVPAPPSDSTGTPPPAYYLLRPILANLKYEKALEHIARFLSDLCSILHRVGHTTAQFTLFERPLASSIPPPTAGSASRQLAASEGVCMAFLNPREFTFELTLAPDIRLSIRSRTTNMPLRTQYLIQLHPPPTGGSSPLQDSFPPADNYATLRDVLDYVSSAVGHVLAADARKAAIAHEDASQTGVIWSRTVDGTALQHQNDPLWEMRFSLTSTDTITELDEILDADVDEGDGREADGDGHVLGNPNLNTKSETADEDGPREDGGDDTALVDDDSPLRKFCPPELRLYASWPHGTLESAVYRRWAWTAESPQQQKQEDASPSTLHDIVQGCINGELKPAADTDQ